MAKRLMTQWTFILQSLTSTEVTSALKFPSFCKDKEFRQFITQMLNKNVISRLIKPALIRKHTWYEDFNWDKLESLSIEVPYVPKLKKENLTKSESYATYMVVLR